MERLHGRKPAPTQMQPRIPAESAPAAPAPEAPARLLARAAAGAQLRPNDVLALQRALGNRAVGAVLAARSMGTPEPGVVQRQWYASGSVSYQHGAAGPDTGGSWMEAYVGRFDRLARGTRAKRGVPPLSHPSRLGPMKGRYVGGHLLAEEMGGRGESLENITVLTTTANRNHATWERRIWNDLAGKAKHADTATGNQQLSAPWTHGTHYTVQVNGATPDGTSNFPDEDLVAESIDLTIEPVRWPSNEEPEDAATAGRLGAWAPTGLSFGIPNGPVPITNAPPYPPAPQTTTATTVTAPVTTATTMMVDDDSDYDSGSEPDNSDDDDYME